MVLKIGSHIFVNNLMCLHVKLYNQCCSHNNAALPLAYQRENGPLA